MSSKRFAVLALLLSLTQISFAGFWDTVKFWETSQVETLIISGNYVKSRLLAEIVQNEEKAPMILFSPKSGKDEFYYMPYGKDAHVKQSNRLAEMVKFINPKTVIVIGDKKYVGTAIIKLLNNSPIPTTHISGDNWLENAKLVSKRCNDKNILKDYIKLNAKLFGTVEEGDRVVVEDEADVVLEAAPVVLDEGVVAPVGEPLAEPMTEPEVVTPEVIDEPTPEFDENAPQIIEQIPSK